VQVEQRASHTILKTESQSSARTKPGNVTASNMPAGDLRFTWAQVLIAKRINIETAQGLTNLASSSAAQDIGGTASFPGTMKLVRVPGFKNNPLYLLALKMLRFDIRNVAVFFRWNGKGGAPVDARMRWAETDFETG